jgi:glycosyltransferase involved in cell wall biosynthesis
MSHLLSIITVNLNNREGLRKTLNSVFIQTFTDFEYIIIDGASTDGSVDLIKESGNPFTYWVSEPDSGVYQAMNKGISHSAGEYLLFLNSGDFLESDTALEQVFNTNHPQDILTCGYKLAQNGKIFFTTIPPKQITFGYLYLSGINHQSTFIRRELFLKSGFYREDFKYNSDIEFWFRTIILENASIMGISAILTVYNLEGISSIESSKPEFQEELRKIFSHPFFEKFIPDYDTWKKEKAEMKVLYWARSKKTLYTTLKLIYKLAVFLRSIKPKRNQ